MAFADYGGGLSAFAKAFDEAQARNPEYRLRQRAEAELAFDASPLGQRLIAHNLQKQAAGEAARFERDRGYAIEGIVSYFSKPEEQEAIRNTLDGFDLASVKRFNRDTVDNKEFTGLVHLNPDEIDSKTYLPIVQGDFKQLGTTNYWYHSAKSLKGKTASAGDTYTRKFHMYKRAYKDENGVDTVPDEEKRKLQERAFESLTPNQRILFNTQSTNFNAAIDNTITKYRGSLIITDKTFNRKLKDYGVNLAAARTSGGSLQKQREIAEDIRILKERHKQQQQTGYGYSESQYRSELRNMLSRSVGALGLSDANQIENFMTQFLEDERNQARLLNRLISKYGAPKTGTGAAGATRGSNARTKSISEAKVTNTRLDSRR